MHWWKRADTAMEASLTVEAEEHPETDEAKLRRIVEEILAAERTKAPAAWSADARRWAEQNGILRGDGDAMAYAAPCTREQAVVMLHRLWQLLA